MPKAPQQRDDLEDDPPETGEEEQEEEEQEEEEEEEVEPPSLIVPPPPRVTPIREPSYRQPPRRGTGKKGLAGPKKSPRFPNKEADTVWPQLLSEIEASGHSAYEIQIFVQAPGQSGPITLGMIDGGTVSGGGSVSPGEALIHRIEDSYHLVSPPEGEVVYTLKFQWKANGQPIKEGRLILPPKRQIMAMREQAFRDTQAQGHSYGPPPGVGRSWGGEQLGPVQPRFNGSYQAYPYPPASAQAPYYPPPPPQQQAQSVDPYIRQSIETLTSMLNEVREENARLRNQPPPAPYMPPPMPAGFGAPPQPPPSPGLTEEGVAKAIMMAFQTFLPHLRAGTGAPQTQDSMEAEMLRHTQGMIRDGFQQFMGAMFKSRGKEAVAGLGAPMQEEVPAPAEIVEAPKPEDGLPFTAIPLDAKFSDGRPVVFAMSKETGQIDPMGAVMSNPFILEKGMELLVALKDAVGKLGAGGGPHIVHRTPQQAQDANPKPPSGNTGGSGWD